MAELKTDLAEASEPKWLHDLGFIDLYVSLGVDLPSYYQTAEPGSFIVLPRDLPGAYAGDVAQLRKELEGALREVEEAGITFDGMRLRASKVRNTRGETWAALRRIEEKPPAIDGLGFTAPIVQALADLGKREGLVLVCGGTGQGKTTTAASLLHHYLVRHGGVAFTIEDPVEYLLDGRHGEAGLCYQVEAKREADWAELLKRALRWHPRYIMVGELRTPEAANQLLRAANSGHLVITTMHSGSLVEGLEGVLHLAEQAIGDHAPILLASGLAAVLYQNFLPHSVDGTLYVTESGNLGDSVRALIRERHIGQATTFVDQQMARRSRPNS
ncbi:MAG: ATPase, T2SS/T4P/T4SS family [Bdellovibrionales bacterium]